MTTLAGAAGPEQSPAEDAHIVIIGGGITGLSAAFALEQAIQRGAHNVRYTVIERAPRFGGKIYTDTIPGESGDFIVEGGPDSFIGQKPWGIQLAQELGLGEQLMGTQKAPHSTYVLIKGRPLPMPEGMMLIIPTRLMPFVRSPILSLRGKLRMALDLVIPARRDNSDETLADFIRRRLGSEALEKLAEPLLSGIHSSDPERQSLQATFARFHDMEKKYGSLTRAILASRKRPAAPPANSSIPEALRRSPFVTLRGGVSELVRALLARLNGRMISGHGVQALEPGGARRYRLRLDDGETIDADALILATPTYAAADLVAPFEPALAQALHKLRYVTTGTITLAYRRGEIGQPLDGFGLVIPQSEHRRINAITMSSNKFGHRAPSGYTLVRVFVGGARTPEALELDDSQLAALACDELREILGITARPLWSRVYRWPQANPQYDIGHIAWAESLKPLQPDMLYLAGSAYTGVGIPDCIHQGRQAAEQALAQISARTGAPEPALAQAI